MPFFARCPVCGHTQICVLDPRGEPRVRCARCRRDYLAREPELAAVPAPAEAAPADPVPAPIRPARPSPSETEDVDGPGPDAAAAAAPDESPPPVDFVEFTEPGRPSVGVLPAVPKGPAPLSVAALVLLAGALVFALIGVAAFLVWGLAGTSLVLGLWEIRRRYLSGSRLHFQAALASVAGAVFLAALFAPGLLGPRYRAATESGPDPAGIQVVPLPHFAHETDQLTAEWVNANRASLRQGRVRVEIPEVWTGPAAKTPGREPAGRWLYVRVRLYRSRTGAEIAEGAFAKTLAWDQTVRATLRDATGTAYEQLPARPSAARPGGASVAAGTSLDVTDEVLAFPGPADVGSELRLEVLGAAWGGSGVFRFALPAEMIQHHPAPARGKKGP